VKISSLAHFVLFVCSLFLVKGKGKVVPVLLTEQHAMKAYWGVEE
jgi:hypothetical protein